LSPKEEGGAGINRGKRSDPDVRSGKKRERRVLRAREKVGWFKPKVRGQTIPGGEGSGSRPPLKPRVGEKEEKPVAFARRL